MLSIPPPLIVTRAFCTELHIRVPSWTAPEVFVHEPLSIRAGDLFIDLRNALECDEATRTQAMERARSATLEADPFGSIATWYAFSTTISERLELSVDNVYIKIFVGGISRVRVELSALHARTTNALWQEMRDLVNCVDRSPDGTLKTRFKLVSCSGSVFLQQQGASGSSESPNGGGAGSLRVLHDHPIVLRMTLFSQRKSKNESWETLSQVVDVNLEKLAFDYQIAELFDVADVLQTFYKWMTDSRNDSLLTTDSGMGLSSSMMLHQRLQRSSSADSHHSTRRKQTLDSDKGGEFDEEQQDDSDEAVEGYASFAAQITFRFSVQAAIHFQSERMGPQEVVLHVHNAALNVIMNQDDSRELHLTLQKLTLTFQNHVVFYLKPSRDPLRVKRFRESVYVNWHLQRIECRVEKDLARICNEMYHSVHEKQQSACITCGMCLQQIPLDQIELHVCTGNTRSPASSVTSNRSASNASCRESSASTADMADLPSMGEDALTGCKVKLRFELILDDFELHADSHLFQNVQQLLQTLSPSSYAQVTAKADRSFAVHMKALQLTTESKEFVGDSVFVPVLPLAFQMLECTINGCGCIHKRKPRRAASSKHDDFSRDSDRSDSYSSSRNSCLPNFRLSQSVFGRWPDRLFIDIDHVSISSVLHNKENQDTFVKVDKIHIRTSFSDGLRVCTACHPQMSGHAAVERIRVQAEPVAMQFIRRNISQLMDQHSTQPVEISTLFLAVLELKAIEFTLLEANSPSAHMKHLFKHVAIVADNQMGYLSYQSNFDFRMLGTSECITFTNQQRNRSENNNTDCGKDLFPSRQERRRLRQRQEQQDAVKMIQRSLRRLTQDRKMRQISNVKDTTLAINELDESDKKQDIQPPQVKTTHISMNEHHHSGEQSDSASSDKRKHSSGSSIFSSPEDLINPMKMVAAAGVITKFVKSKQQMLESEMSDLANQSKESATRMVSQPYSACKKLFGSMVNPSSENEQAAPDQMPVVVCSEAEPDELDEEEDGPASLFPTVESRSASRHRSGEIKNESNSRVASIALKDQVPDTSSPDSAQFIAMHEKTEEVYQQQLLLNLDTKDSNVVATSDQMPSAAFALSANELTSLPAIVRILVQIQEQRLWVPINPREKIDVLCHEIVRRFNEMFGSQLEGKIENVSLQDVHGGVFSSSDLVGFALSLQTQENIGNISKKTQLLFAHPIRRQGIRSFAHINDMLQSTMVKNDPKITSTKQVGLKFSRCSKLPLPLAVALLANELERDLLHCVVKEGSYGNADSGKVDEWPDLALNASFLEPHTMLQVEVRWFGRCLEVTNVDAFVLCLQQLGLCTSRPSSKYVGKILRDRLKVDAKNTLLRSAVQRSPEYQQHQSQPKSNEDEQPPPADSSQHLTYESLREIVQEDCGVYIVKS